MRISVTYENVERMALVAGFMFLAVFATISVIRVTPHAGEKETKWVAPLMVRADKPIVSGIIYTNGYAEDLLVEIHGNQGRSGSAYYWNATATIDFWGAITSITIPEQCLNDRTVLKVTTSNGAIHEYNICIQYVHWNADSKDKSAFTYVTMLIQV